MEKKFGQQIVSAVEE